ncbi:MAG: circularly permuted type 2 ATP-grasp protein, partial [Myxococcales bacterium]|nr:circularly permuted type 2 ATP-grasp protein [Myxococcales bacterium]
MMTGALASYRGGPAGFDELTAPDGTIRPHWRDVARILSDMTPEAIAAAARQAARMFDENGVNYNVFSDPARADRLGEIDAVPMVIASSEWDALSRGIAQRAHVLNRMIGDLYGVQRLLSQRVVRPEVLFANPGFLRSCHGAAPAGGVFLHQYAADLVRDVDGRWVVVADRTQAPSGLGYALENRIVTSRLFANAFRQVNVRRVGAYFDGLRESLLALAPAGRSNPRVVVLTPGSEDDEYFEHAYLARYLGFAMVECQDLTTTSGHHSNKSS